MCNVSRCEGWRRDVDPDIDSPMHETELGPTHPSSSIDQQHVDLTTSSNDGSDSDVEICENVSLFRQVLITSSIFYFKSNYEGINGFGRRIIVFFVESGPLPKAILCV